MKKLPLIICGANGRVGSELVAQITASSDLELAGACTRELSLAQVASQYHADQRPIVIDFSLPEGLSEHTKVAMNSGFGFVVGVSGISDEQRVLLKQASEKIPVLIAANTSVGANILALLSAQTAKLMPNADIEISEIHHRLKKDSPSGTAHFLVDQIAKAREIATADAACLNRHQAGLRKMGEIGVVGMRGGDAVGTHTVHFLEDGETLEITHRATDRRVWAKGALRAARFLAMQPAGLYSMLDVFKLNAFGDRLND